jgi:hypothetical protein
LDIPPQVAALESARLGFSRIAPVVHVSCETNAALPEHPKRVLLRCSKFDVNVTRSMFKLNGGEK